MAAWQGDLRALAALIRQDPRYIACPFTLVVASMLRHQAEQTHTRWRGDPQVRTDRDEARKGLDALARAWKGLNQRGRRPGPTTSAVALLGHALTEVYTEAKRVRRAVRFPEALKVAKRKICELGGVAWVHPDQWGPWIEEDLGFLRNNPRRVKTVVTDRLGNSTVYVYNNNGDIVQKTDATGAVYGYGFDGRGKPSPACLPDPFMTPRLAGPLPDGVAHDPPRADRREARPSPAARKACP
jgi:hypothetical protein